MISIGATQAENKKKHSVVLCISFCFVFFLVLYPQSRGWSQESNAYLSLIDDVIPSSALFEFYQGVELANMFFYPEALVALQRALSISPSTTLFKFWLSKMYYLYGQQDVAVSLWEEFIAGNFFEPYLNAKIDLLRSYEFRPTLDFSQYVRSISIDLNVPSYTSPVSIRGDDDSTLMLVSLGAKKIITLTQTGTILKEYAGTVNDFDFPTDALMLGDKSIIVLEFATNKIRHLGVDGRTIRVFNDTNAIIRGPQYLAVGQNEQIYVSMFGSKLIEVFSRDGEHIQTIGSPTRNFAGLDEPLSLVVYDNTVCVANNNNGRYELVFFDKNGSYLRTTSIGMSPIEGLRTYNNTILVTTHDTVILFDPITEGILDVFSDVDFVKLSSSFVDENSTLWVLDRGRNKLEAFIPLFETYTGLNLTIRSVNTDDFPTVTVSANVSSSRNQSVRGLREGNFSITENKDQIVNYKVLEDSSLIRETDVVIIPLLEKTQSLAERKAISDALDIVLTYVQSTKDILTYNFWVVSQETPPKFISNKERNIESIARKVDAMQAPANPNYILSMRSAVNTLLQSQGRPNILFVGNPRPTLKSAQEQTLAQLEQIVVTNKLRTFWLVTNDMVQLESENSLFEWIETMVINTGGSIMTFPFEQTADTQRLVDAFESHIPGTYLLQYTSPRKSTIQQEYRSLSIQTNFFVRSGRDLSGYVLSNTID